MRVLAVCSLIASFTLVVSAIAQSAATSVSTAPGKLVRLGYYSFLRSDCTGGAKPNIRVPTHPAHGELIIKSAVLATKRLQQCGEVKAPTEVVFYKANADYVGADPVTFDVLNSETGQVQHVNVLVEVMAPTTNQ